MNETTSICLVWTFQTFLSCEPSALPRLPRRHCPLLRNLRTPRPHPQPKKETEEQRQTPQPTHLHYLQMQSGGDAAAASFTVRLRRLNGADVSVTCQDSSTVNELRDLASGALNVPAERLRLLYKVRGWNVRGGG